LEKPDFLHRGSKAHRGRCRPHGRHFALVGPSQVSPERLFDHESSIPLRDVSGSYPHSGSRRGCPKRFEQSNVATKRERSGARPTPCGPVSLSASMMCCTTDQGSWRISVLRPLWDNQTEGLSADEWPHGKSPSFILASMFLVNDDYRTTADQRASTSALVQAPGSSVTTTR
jgi:hypothetical protein